MGNECLSACQQKAEEVGLHVDPIGAGAGSPDDEKFTDPDFPPERSSLLPRDPNDVAVELYPDEIDMLENTDFR